MLFLDRVVDFGSFGLRYCVLANHQVGVKSPISRLIACSAELLRRASDGPGSSPQNFPNTEEPRGEGSGDNPIGQQPSMPILMAILRPSSSEENSKASFIVNFIRRDEKLDE